MNISVVILAKNEERNLAQCIKTVSFADEVIVIDDESSDGTFKIAKKLKVKVIKHKLNNNFAEQRNFSLRRAHGRWVLFIDADERVTANLRAEIIEKINSPESQTRGFFISRTDYIWKKRIQYGEVGNIKLLRLGKRNSGIWKRKVHEAWDIKGKVGILENPLEHYPHRSVKEFLSSINHWSSLHAVANNEEQKRANLFKIIFFPVGHFAKNYFFKLGFMDGNVGLVVAILMSFHSFLGWGKLWALQKN